MNMTLVEVAVRASQVSRLGRISATPCLMEAIPRAAMVRAVRSHCQSVGDTTETRHSFEGTLFRIRTEAGGVATAMWLEKEGSPAWQGGC